MHRESGKMRDRERRGIEEKRQRLRMMNREIWK